MAVHTEPERETRSEFEGTQAEARTTKLTEEAKAHLTAAGHLADSHFAITRAMIESAISPLIEANRHIGFDLTLSDEEVTRVVMAVRGALDYGQEEVVEPIFARLRGEAPHVSGSADQPHLPLEEEEVQELIADLYRLGAAAAYGENEQCEERELRNCLVAISLKVPRIVADIERSAGMEISGQERDAIYDDVEPWGERALSLGGAAVEEVDS